MPCYHLVSISGQKEKAMELIDLVGKDLQGYSVQKLHEVYRVNEDGRKAQSIGYFRSEIIAKAFAEHQTDASWHRTAEAFVLTDGKDGFLLTGESVTLLDDEQASLDARNAAVSKLTAAERTLLGL
jgi:hypothetical protein